jgi:DNA protecting protein DprA
MTETERWAWVAVWSCQGLGPTGLAKLRERVSPSKWFALTGKDLVAILKPAPKLARELLSLSSIAHRAERLEKQVRVSGQRVCFLHESEYPRRLREIERPPPLLFFRGAGANAVHSSRGCVAIVGTRRTSKEWLEWTRRFAAACVAQRLVVLSGGAEGIDSAAHQGAVEACGQSWAFVASGLDQLDAAPRMSVERLLSGGGTVFSVHPPGARAEKGLFVQRNRLISGSADAVVVVRGGDDSGARHTARFAVEHQRALLAVPGSPLETGSELCRSLLRAGARHCFDVDDVLASLSLQSTQTPSERVKGRDAISEAAHQVYAQLPRGVFDFAQALSHLPEHSSGAVSAALMELELAGWVETRTGRRYEKGV